MKKRNFRETDAFRFSVPFVKNEKAQNTLEVA